MKMDPLQHHVVQVENVLANQMLLAPNVHIVSQVFMDIQVAKVKLKHCKNLILGKMLRIFKTFQSVNVTPLDPLQHHAVQLVCVLANQMLMAPNVQLVSQVIMDFPTAKVKIKAVFVSTNLLLVIWQIYF